MPANKNASFRYRVINQCLRNTGRKWSLQDLIDEVSDEMYEQFGIDKGVSKRTVQYDINTMRSDPPRGFAAPIVCENGHYFYEEPDYSIDNNPLNETDIENLNEAAAILKQFRHLPLYGEMESMLGKLQENIFQNDQEMIVAFEQNQHYKNLDKLSGLYKLLKSGKKALVQYQSFKDDKPVECLLNPLLLKEYRNRWFLFSWSDKFDNYTNLAIDRILSFEQMVSESDTSRKETLLKMLTQVIGVSIPYDQQPENIEFWVSHNSLDYFLTKPVHHSQQLLKKDENGAQFRIEVIPNFELEQLFLSYGENLEVKKPEYLRKQISQRLHDSVQQYK